MLSAQRLTSRLLVVKRKMKDSNPYDISAVPQFSRLLAVHSAASSMQRCLGELESPNTDVTNQRRDRFGFRHSGYWSELNRHLSTCKVDALPIKLQTHFCMFNKPLFGVKVTRAICVFSVTKGTPPMSYYTLFKGWLLLSLPIGFFALLVLKRPLY